MAENVKKIMMIAGETSGDYYGGKLITALKDLSPDMEIIAMGGACMAEAGAEIIQDFKGLDVMGFWDVLVKLFTFKRVLKDMVSQMKERRPDAVVLIDYPGFNLRFAHAACKQGIPVIYFISPKVWAHGSGRIPKLVEYCDKMLVFFEFELDVYKGTGLDVVWVGHPLAEDLEQYKDKRESYKEELGVPLDSDMIGIFPGSRQREIKRMFPAMLDAAAKLEAKLKDPVFMVGCAPLLKEEYLSSFFKKKHPVISMVKGKTREIMAASDACIVTSGTATLEAGIIGTPHVLCYSLGIVTYVLVKPLMKVKDIGIVNIAAGRRIMPELVQFDLTAENIAREVESLITDKEKRKKADQDLAEMVKRLRRDGAVKRSAEEIMSVIKSDTAGRQHTY